MYNLQCNYNIKSYETKCSDKIISNNITYYHLVYCINKYNNCNIIKMYMCIILLLFFMMFNFVLT